MLEKYTELKPKGRGLEKKIEEISGGRGILEEMLLRFHSIVASKRGRIIKEADMEPLAIESEPDISGTKEREMFPISAESIHTTEYLGGSSEVRAGYFEDELLVVKKARKSVNETTGSMEINTEQLIDEYVADRIYEAMGFGVPVSKIYGKGQYKVSKFIPGKDLNAFSGFDPELKKIKDELQRGFVLDCLLANWDVIGTAGGDNIRLGYDGKVYRLDNGGALRFRARGARKGDEFGDKVGELSSLRIKNEIFSSISDEEVERQIRDILENKNIIFSAITASAEAMGLLVEDLEEVIAIIEKRIQYLSIYLEEKIKPITDKGIYESVATSNYFEGWDEIRIEGNYEIKDTIRGNIMRAEKEHQANYESIATALGISVEEFKAQLQAKIENMVDGTDFFRATEVGVLERIMLVDGRWKSQFETGRSNGSFDPSFRGISEMKMFGFNKTNDMEEVVIDNRDYYYSQNIPGEVLAQNKDMRPIYGYFSDDEHGGINGSSGKIPPPTNVYQYGNVNFKIKRGRALEKATITFHDSLGPGNNWPPTPAAKPHFTSFNVDSPRDNRFLEELNKSSVVNWGEFYTEVQYHGQLTMDDVESIHISTNNDLGQGEIEIVRRIFNEYKRQHPESTIQLIEF